jgi:hypothetical protein
MSGGKVLPPALLIIEELEPIIERAFHNSNQVIYSEYHPS